MTYLNLLFILVIINAQTMIEMNGGMDMPDEFMDMANMPVPGEMYDFMYQDTMQHLMLNDSVKYFDMDAVINCMMEMDEYGDIDADSSYITVNKTSKTEAYEIGTIILAVAPTMDKMHYNCTTFPAVCIENIIDGSDNTLMLYVREAEMFEYISDLEVNITNGSTLDTGIDMGEMKKVENMGEYFNQSIISTDNDGNRIEKKFMNVSYEEMVYVCQNYTEDGTLIAEYPSTDGICGDTSVISYFGQMYGVDSVIIGNNSVIGNDDEYGVTELNLQTGGERRLGFTCFFRKIARRVVSVVKKVVEIVKTIIDILRGDINKRIFESALIITSNKAFSVDGMQERTINDDTTLTTMGSFSIASGIEFYSGVYVDLEAKYTIFSLNPSFDYFKLVVGGEARFDAYVDINIEGSAEIRTEIGHVERRKTFFIGPIPVVIKPYATVTLGLISEISLSFATEFGFEPIYVEYGIEYSKNNGWNRINNKNLELIPYKNFGTDQGSNCENSFSVAPFIELQFGIVFYEIVDLHIIPVLSLVSSIEYPAACGDIDEICSENEFYVNFGISFELDLNIGLAVGNNKIGLGTYENSWNIYSIEPVNVFDSCFSSGISTTSILGQICCGTSEIEINPLIPFIYVNQEETNWFDAQTYCNENYGTNLATITSKTLDDYAKNMLSNIVKPIRIEEQTNNVHLDCDASKSIIGIKEISESNCDYWNLGPNTSGNEYVIVYFNSSGLDLDLNRFGFQSFGDVTHDINTFKLECTNEISTTEPNFWTTLVLDNGESGNTNMQYFSFSSFYARDCFYYKFTIISRYSRFQAWVKNIVFESKEYVTWIGLNDIENEDNFVWSSGATYAYTNWNYFMPDNSGDDDCVQIHLEGWNDVPCIWTANVFLCDNPLYVPISAKQIGDNNDNNNNNNNTNNWFKSNFQISVICLLALITIMNLIFIIYKIKSNKKGYNKIENVKSPNNKKNVDFDGEMEDDLQV